MLTKSLHETGCAAHFAGQQNDRRQANPFERARDIFELTKIIEPDARVRIAALSLVPLLVGLPESRFLRRVRYAKVVENRHMRWFGKFADDGGLRRLDGRVSA